MEINRHAEITGNGKNIKRRGEKYLTTWADKSIRLLETVSKMAARSVKRT